MSRRAGNERYKNECKKEIKREEKYSRDVGYLWPNLCCITSLGSHNYFLNLFLNISYRKLIKTIIANMNLVKYFISHMMVFRDFS